MQTWTHKWIILGISFTAKAIGNDYTDIKRKLQLSLEICVDLIG